jgi:hypothetical protein
MDQFIQRCTSDRLDTNESTIIKAISFTGINAEDLQVGPEDPKLQPKCQHQNPDPPQSRRSFSNHMPIYKQKLSVDFVGDLTVKSQLLRAAVQVHDDTVFIVGLLTRVIRRTTRRRIFRIFVV